MSNQPYRNDSSQFVRRAMLKNDRSNASTFNQFAHDDTAGGRYASVNKSHVTGRDPAPWYPAQPAGSPWADEQATEPPLDFDISAAPVVGEFFEVAASLAGEGINPLASPPNDPPCGEPARSDAGPRTGVIETGSPLPHQRKRHRRVSK